MLKMHKRGLFLLLTILLSSWTFSSWSEFISYEGKFRVMTPGKMLPKVNVVETAIGSMNYHTFIHQSTDKAADNLIYMVSYCDYPEHTISSDSVDLVDDFFDTTIESAVKSVSGELRYSSAIELGEYPGRLWRVDYSEGAALIKTKAFLVGNRYYSIQTITLKNRSMNNSTDKFMESFDVID